MHREKVIWMAIIPQIIILLISIFWIYLSPKDNILIYFKFNFLVFIEGALTGIGLAISGYGFYKISLKVKSLSHVVELFETVLSPVFKKLKIVDMVLLSFISGFCEEILFRGLLLPKLGIIVSSVCFGIVHMPGSKFWIYTIWAIGSGALFGWLFLLSGSLWLPIIAHTTNNLIGMVLLTRMANKKNI